jgi:hypothetical protein
VLACGAAAACSDDDSAGPPAAPADPLEQIKVATFAAGSARYTGETRFADGTSGPIEGISQAEPAAGEVTYPVSTPTGIQEAKLVWLDDTLYTRRVVTDSPNSVSSTQRMPDELPWTRAPYNRIVVMTFDAYDPFRLLERLELLGGAEAVAKGNEQVDGEALQRYDVDLADNPVAPAGAQRIELLTDGEQRLEHVRLVGDDSIEYSLDDFGVEVTPTPPSDDEIGVPRPIPGPEPAGPFEQVGQGVQAGVTWQLMRAPSTDEGTCWRLDTDLPLDPVAPNPEGVTCISAFDPSGLPGDQAQAVADAGRDAPFDAVVFATGPTVVDARVVFADRSSQPLAVDPGGFVVYVGPKTPLAGVVELTTADGTVVTCGPGPVSEISDLRELPPEELADLDQRPWLCL